MRKKISIIISLTILATFSIFILTKGNSKDKIESAQHHEELANTDIKKQEPISGKNVNEEEIIPEVITQPDFYKIYNSVDELVESSDLIVEGTVNDSSSFDYTTDNSTVVYTKAEIEVLKVYSGDVKIGDRITFVEPGGETSKDNLGFKEKFPDLSKDKLNEKVKVLFDGIPNMKKNDHVILFGAYGEFPLLDSTYFDVLGAYQGKFTKFENTFARYNDEIKEKSFSSQSESGESIPSNGVEQMKMTPEEFNEKLNNALQKK